MHGTNLHRRGMGTQNRACTCLIRAQIKGIMFLARRVFRRNVQGGKIIKIGFNIRPFGDGKTHIGKDGRNFFHCTAKGMYAPCQWLLDRQANIHTFICQLFAQGICFQLCLAHRYGFGHLILYQIKCLTCLLAQLRFQSAKCFKLNRYTPFFAKRIQTHGFKSGQICCSGNGGQ